MLIGLLLFTVLITYIWKMYFNWFLPPVTHTLSLSSSGFTILFTNCLLLYDYNNCMNEQRPDQTKPAPLIFLNLFLLLTIYLCVYGFLFEIEIPVKFSS